MLTHPSWENVADLRHGFLDADDCRAAPDWARVLARNGVHVPLARPKQVHGTTVLLADHATPASEGDAVVAVGEIRVGKGRACRVGDLEFADHVAHRGPERVGVLTGRQLVGDDLGHEIADPQAGEFLSRYSAEELRAPSRDRAVRWQSAPPRDLRRTSIEDQYLAEAAWHVQRRNEVEDAQRVWHENLILETYFAPALDFPTYATGVGARWPHYVAGSMRR